MKKINVIQNALWAIFLLYYCGEKFFAGYQGYSHLYLLQVGIIVLLTAVIPFYGTKVAMRYEPARFIVAVFLPSLLAMSGYGAFYITFIAPNFPDVPATAVIVRGIVPGVVISMILCLPAIINRWQKRAVVA